MESSQFSDSQSPFESIEQIDAHGATCDTFRVKLYGKLHFLKRLKPQFSGDIRYVEAQRKEFETGYRLEHPNLVRYVSLSDEGILMEYVDGETLSERLASHPEYFNRQNSDKLLRQLLGVVGYLHSHQVLHLDLKPDNILLTRINNDVKLVDLGCCYTDTFVDTHGFTESFAAPEQLSIIHCPLSVRTDIYAVGKILELLPNHHIYNKVIARATAADPAQRYMSAEAMMKALSKPRTFLWAVPVAVLTVIIVAFAIFSEHPYKTVTESIIESEDSVGTQLSVVPQHPDSQQLSSPPSEKSVAASPRPSFPRSEKSVEASPRPSSSPSEGSGEASIHQMERELDRLMDVAYRSTISSFCDSVFPSLTVGRQWEAQSSEAHAQTLQAAAELSSKYPDIPESVIIQHVEQRFQSLVGYVFNRMRENGTKTNAE